MYTEKIRRLMTGGESAVIDFKSACQIRFLSAWFLTVSGDWGYLAQRPVEKGRVSLRKYSEDRIQAFVEDYGGKDIGDAVRKYSHEHGKQEWETSWTLPDVHAVPERTVRTEENNKGVKRYLPAEVRYHSVSDGLWIGFYNCDGNLLWRVYADPESGRVLYTKPAGELNGLTNNKKLGVLFSKYAEVMLPVLAGLNAMIELYPGYFSYDEKSNIILFELEDFQEVIPKSTPSMPRIIPEGGDQTYLRLLDWMSAKYGSPDDLSMVHVPFKALSIRDSQGKPIADMYPQPDGRYVVAELYYVITPGTTMPFETSTAMKNGFPYFGKGSSPLPMFVRRQDTLTGNHVVSFTFADRVLFSKREDAERYDEENLLTDYSLAIFYAICAWTAHTTVEKTPIQRKKSGSRISNSPSYENNNAGANKKPIPLTGNVIRIKLSDVEKEIRRAESEARNRGMCMHKEHVRGHERHLSDGRTTWVRPYIRYANLPDAGPAEYIIRKEDVEKGLRS